MADILDWTGKSMPKPEREILEAEIAAPETGTVRSITSGYPADGLTPSRMGQILRSAHQGDPTAYLELAEQMEEKDLHYRAVLDVRKRAIRRLKLVVEPGANDPKAEEAAELVRAALGHASLKDDLIDMLDAIGKGYSGTELIWDLSSVPWKVRRMEYVNPDYFRFDQVDGKTPLLRTNDGDVPLKQFKFIFHCSRGKAGLPIRSGLALVVAWAYIFKNYTLKDWNIFLEAYGHPLRIGKYGNGASAQEKSTLLRAVRRLGVDMAAIMPQSMEVEIVNGNVTGADAMFENSARFWDEQVSKVVLGQVSTTDAIAGGHAVGKVHNEVRTDIRDADAEQLAGTLQRDLAAAITMLNLGADVAVPVIRFEAEEDRDPRLTLAAIKQLGPLGLSIPERVARDAFGIREPEDGEAVLTFPSQTPAPSGGGVKPLQLAAQHSASAQVTRDTSALRDVVDKLVQSGAAQAAMDPLLGPLLDAIGDARSLEDVRDIIATAAEEADDETFRELLALLMFNAQLAGQVGADTR